MLKKCSAGIVLIVLLLCSCKFADFLPQISFGGEQTSAGEIYMLDDLPDYSGKPYVEINGNEPLFEDAGKKVKSSEFYSELDYLGRCGYAYACLGRDLMPTAERQPIGSVRPSGWKTVKYDFVDGNYLYNRCHLIGFQLSGENANPKNLITGTRYMNTQGMLPFENMVADYIKETGNHVLYRVTPYFVGEDLLAKGVVMEGLSVEDGGDGICFNVFCYNVQPGVKIDYSNGESVEIKTDGQKRNYILNTGTKKFHRKDCDAVGSISSKNRQDYSGTRENLIMQGYTPCKGCNP